MFACLPAAPRAGEDRLLQGEDRAHVCKDMVDFDTFSKSDFRAVKIKACEAVKKSKKLLKFTLNDGDRHGSRDFERHP